MFLLSSLDGIEKLKQLCQTLTMKRNFFMTKRWIKAVWALAYVRPEGLKPMRYSGL